MALKNFLRFGQLGIELPPEERRAVLEDLFVFGKENQRPYFNRMATLLVISTIIAACGLLSDSAAVVIGAMLVAPMMGPVMSAAAAITLGWSSRLYQAMVLSFFMAVAAVAISVLVAYVSPELYTMPEQVTARTKPTFFDLVIALAAGSGGAYTMTRKESSAIPGVAMAVALLPPLASCGILLVAGAYNLALKAFILFFTNFAAMVLAGSLTFLLVGVSPSSSREKTARFTRNYLLAFVVLVVGISIPLYFYSNEVWYDATYKANQSVALQEWLKENELRIDDVQIDEKNHILFLKLSGPNPPLTVEALYSELENKYLERQKEKIPDDFSIEVAWTKTAVFSWPPVENADDRQLTTDFTKGFKNHTWHWIGTQYTDGDWLRPEHLQDYFFEVSEDNDLLISSHCNSRGKGSYSINQEEIVLEVKLKIKEKSCESFKTDQRYAADLQQVVNIQIEGNNLSLRLNNDHGVMYFERP